MLKIPYKFNISNRTKWAICISFILLIVIAFFPEVYIFPSYYLIIRPIGEHEINDILTRVDKIENTEEKINTIAFYEIKNFKNAYNLNPNLALDFGTFLINRYGRYPIFFDDGNPPSVKIRVNAQSNPLPLINQPFINDPYWIVFFKTGACGELAHQFYYFANKTKIESQLVGSAGEDHNWVEIKFNGEWYYFDPSKYYEFQGNQTYKAKWFNKTIFFKDAWNWNLSRVTIESTGKDITDRYTEVKNLTLAIQSGSQLSIEKFDQGKNKWTKIYVTTINVSNYRYIQNVQLGKNNKYKITAEKYPFFWPVQMFDEKEFFIYDTNRTTILFNFEKARSEINLPLFFLFGVIMILIVECLVVIKFTRRRKKD